ncbi:MAG: hypothetical protein Q8L48_34400 [Archangium sp.]|nr:hypothetical protein [Archangium sp.]
MVVKVRTLLLLAALGAALANATTLLALDVPALTKGSSVVARATVRSVAARWSKDGGRIMTDVVLDVTEPWKGTPARQVTVMQPGGVVGEVGQLVHGTARFTVGEDVVVFLEPRGDRFLVTGMLQGKFKVETSSDGKAVFARQELEGEALLVDPATRQAVQPPAVVLPIDTLRAQVLAASGAKAPTEPTTPGPVKVSP